MSKLVLDHLSKQYPGCRALDDVSVTFESGKVNALLGKNGSGKSTMIKCIAGVTRPTSGEIYLDEKKLSFSSPSEANRQGISTIFVSSELEELIEVCHRILIMREGRIVGEVNPDHISVEELYAICMEDIDS